MTHPANLEKACRAFTGAASNTVEESDALDGILAALEEPAPVPRPARDVAHDIIDKSGWYPGHGVSLTDAADAIVDIIRADRDGGD